MFCRQRVSLLARPGCSPEPETHPPPGGMRLHRKLNPQGHSAHSHHCCGLAWGAGWLLHIAAKRPRLTSKDNLCVLGQTGVVCRGRKDGPGKPLGNSRGDREPFGYWGALKPDVPLGRAGMPAMPWGVAIRPCPGEHTWAVRCPGGDCQPALVPETPGTRSCSGFPRFCKGQRVWGGAWEEELPLVSL